MTLAEFDVWFALEICRYNNSIHLSLGCTPVSIWDALSGEMASDIPFDLDAFRVIDATAFAKDCRPCRG